MATIRLALWEARDQRRVRWDRLRRTFMGSMIWREMCLNGAGIGMARHLREARIPIVLQLAPTACCAVASGATLPATSAVPTAASPTRPTAATGTTASGLFWPQVSELNGRAEQRRRSAARDERRLTVERQGRVFKSIKKH